MTVLEVGEEWVEGRVAGSGHAAGWLQQCGEKERREE